MGSFGTDSQGHIDTAYRLVADHVRMMTVAISDGLIPSRRESAWVLDTFNMNLYGALYEVACSRPSTCTASRDKLRLAFVYNNFAKLCSTLTIFGMKTRKWIHHHQHVCCSLYNWKRGTSLRLLVTFTNSNRTVLQPTVHVNPVSCCNVWPPTSYLQTCGLLTVLTLMLWIAESVKYGRSVFIESLLRTWISRNCVWLKLGQALLIRRLISGEFVLMHVSTPKESTLRHVLWRVA